MIASPALGALLCITSIAEGGLIFIEGSSKPVAEIVLPRSAGAISRFAAAELEKYLGAMVGTHLNLADGPGPADGARIVLVIGEDRSMPVTQPSAVWPAHSPGADAFQIAVAGDRLVICGASERALLIAVYDLLERLGCRWLGPGEEHVPRITTLTIPRINVSDRPGFTWRGLELISGATPAIIDWMAKARLNVAWPEQYVPNPDMTASESNMRRSNVPDMQKRGMTIFWGGHILPVLFPIERYKSHPEYFAVIKGKRLNPEIDVQDQGQPCVSNPEVLRILAQNAVAFLRNHPWIDVLFVWAGDTTRWCECEKCIALLPDPGKSSPFGGLDRTPLYTRMIKAVSEAVEHELPGRRIAFNHYYNLENIPVDRQGHVLKSLLPGPTVLSAVDDYHQCDRHPFRDASCPRGKRVEPIARMWNAHYEHSVSWSYYFAWNFMLGLPVSQVAKIPDDLRFVRSLGIDGVVDNVSLAPGSLHWMNSDLNFYAYAKAAWNPKLKGDELAVDFIQHYYGPAAEPMALAWQLIDESTRKYGLAPAFMPEDPAFATPEAIHGRMVDIAHQPNTQERDWPRSGIHYVVPNRTVYRRIMNHLDEASRLAAAAPGGTYLFRVKVVRSVIADWDTEHRQWNVFGFLNAGAEHKYALYDQQGDQIRCTIVGGNNVGDCFWPRPTEGRTLDSPGDAAQVVVRINASTAATGSPLYRSGPGLYQADSPTAACGGPDAHTVTFFIGNLDDDTRGPRRVIAMAHDGKFSTAVKSSTDNAWAYGEDVSLRIEYKGAANNEHTYGYSYRTGAAWVPVCEFTFKSKLPHVAPSLHFAFLDRDTVSYPVHNWASVGGFAMSNGSRTK